MADKLLIDLDWLRAGSEEVFVSYYKGDRNLAGHDVQYGKHRTRRSFSRIKEVLDLPNLIEIQTDSFKDFLENGLKEVFEDVLPISNFTETMELEFVGYELKEPK